jgi:hypothetical protein
MICAVILSYFYVVKNCLGLGYLHLQVYFSGTFLPFCICSSLFPDASNISAGDLENIIETETPPQSPLASEAEPLVATECGKLSNNGLTKSSDRRRIHKEPNVSQYGLSTNCRDISDNLNSPLSSLPSSPTGVSKPGSPLSFRPRPMQSAEIGSAFENGQSITTKESGHHYQQDQVFPISEYLKQDFFVMNDTKIDVSNMFIHFSLPVNC